MLKHKIIPTFGIWPLENIRPLDISRFITEISKPGARIDNKNQSTYSDKTVQGYYILLHMLLDKAVRWEMVSENVCDKVDKPRIKKPKVKAYEPDDISRLLYSIELEGQKLEESLKKKNPNHRGKTEHEKQVLMELRRYMHLMHKAYIYLALASAARRSEVCGLNWTDINFDSGYINFERTLQYTKDTGKFIRNCLKNGDTNKDMVLPKMAIKVLKQYKEEQEKYKKLLGNEWVETCKVFTSENGDMINPNNITAWFKRFLKKHNLPYISLHGIRHTGISFLINKNVSMMDISRMAGHSSIAVTADIYGHMFESSKVNMAQVKNEMLECRENVN